VRDKFLGMKTTPRALFTSLSANLRRLARDGDVVALRAYVSNPAFRDGLVVLSPRNLETVMTLWGKARASCDAKTPLLKASSNKRVRWDEAMIARFRQAYAKAKSDEGAARLCGITLNAARMARKRYVDVGATAHWRTAA
jgi:hypothetical protein